MKADADKTEDGNEDIHSSTLSGWFDADYWGEWESMADVKEQAELMQGLADRNFITPSGVQQRGVMRILENQDVVLQAPAGTGKTTAYLLPIFVRLTNEKDATATVVTSSAMLARQVRRDITDFKIAGFGEDVVAVVDGKTAVDADLKARIRIIGGGDDLLDT
eukprot:gene9733-424_t